LILFLNPPPSISMSIPICTKLRDCLVGGHTVTLDGDDLVFGHDQTRLNKDSESEFHSKKGRGAPYPLIALWHCYEQRALKYTQYMSNARKDGYPWVSVLDRKNVIAFLNGSASAASLDNFKNVAAPAGTAPPPKRQKTSRAPSNHTQIQALSTSSTTPVATSKPRTSSSSSSSSSTSRSSRRHRSSQQTTQKRKTTTTHRVSNVATQDWLIDEDALNKIVQIQSKERVFSDRSNFLLSKNNNANIFSNIVELVQATLQHDQVQKRKERRAAKASTSTSNNDESSSSKGEGNPIIIVPSALRSLITTINATSFLQDGRYMSNTALKQKGIVKKPRLTIKAFPIANPTPGNPILYDVIDNPMILKPIEWRRVVCVFAFGPEWQFKGWKYSNPVELFNRTCGFFLHFADEKVHENIKKWSVKPIAISRGEEKRHEDKKIIWEFWKALDHFVALKRSKGVHFATSNRTNLIE